MRRFFPTLILVIFAIFFAYFFIPDETIEIAETTMATKNVTTQTTTKAISTTNNQTDSEHNIYKINISADCLSNNSVGNDWNKVYSINGQQITNGEKIKLSKDITEVNFSVYIEEDDNVPDIATKEITLNLKNSNPINTTLTVTENKGRYTGNTATWEITVSAELVDSE